MESYTKYRLKDATELSGALSGLDNLFVVCCNKCFGEYETAQPQELDAFVSMAQDQGKTVTGIARVDFLCSKTRTGRILEDRIPENTETVAVISCGLGIQTVADLTGRNVLAACDSINYTGHHGMALTKKTCDACAQCYLNMTGGICPVVDCAKSLLDGQCGGAKNGKCEVDPNKDCAWQKIQDRLASQGRLEELKTQGVQIRDYSKVNFKVIHDYVNSIRERRFTGYEGGVHPVQNKERTEHLAICRIPEPDTVVINLAQHAGAPATCIVSVGDEVKRGQKIAEASERISANLHASVSGVVLAIEERPHATRGDMALSVVIQNDHRNTLHESVRPGKPLEELTCKEIVEAVREAGIVGMGGAGFPMDVKLQTSRPIDTVLLNGCECEPMLTADHRVMLEYSDEVLYGLRALMKAVNAPRGIIVIEDNKPDAIAQMQEKTASMEDVSVCVARTKYPQGGEKMLIQTALGRHVPGGGLPKDVGCVVANVSTTKAVSDALQRGMPVTDRVVTVTGDRVKKCGNFLVPIGTDVRTILEYCGIAGSEAYAVKVGGPMMGAVQEDLQVATTKCTNGIIVAEPEEAVPQECIRCGRCADVCPMGREPFRFAEFVENGEELKNRNIMDCMECRSCEYICAAKLPLVSLIRQGKETVRGLK